MVFWLKWPNLMPTGQIVPLYMVCVGVFISYSTANLTPGEFLCNWQLLYTH